MESVSSKVEQYVKHLSYGSVFTFGTVVSKIGNAKKDTVFHALKRLEKKKAILHVKTGIYSRPKMSRFGPVPVPTRKVVQATAGNIGAKVFPSGASALNMLGLSTQIPMSESYISTKRIAPFSIQNSRVSIKYSRSLERISPLFKGLSVKEEETAFQLWLALDYLGESEAEALKYKILEIMESLSPRARKQLLLSFKGRLRWVYALMEEKLL